MLELQISGRVRVCSWKEMVESDRVLLAQAIRVREHASVPVSGFMVGAALRPVGTDRIFRGCNVEDRAQTSTIHAEAAALAAMVSNLGSQALCDTLAIALGPSSKRITSPPEQSLQQITRLSEIRYTPCGHCRGLISQYGGGEIRFVCLQDNGQIAIGTMADFFPCGFEL